MSCDELSPSALTLTLVARPAQADIYQHENGKFNQIKELERPGARMPGAGRAAIGQAGGPAAPQAGKGRGRKRAASERE